MTRTLTILALLSTVACEPPEVPSGPSAAPSPMAEGIWEFELTDPVITGRCEGVRPSDIEGTLLEARVTTPDRSGVIIDLEGIVLRGERRADKLSAEGATRPEVGVHPEGDVPTDEYPTDEARPGDDEDDCGAAGRCDEPDEEVMRISLSGTIDQPTLTWGELHLQWTMDETRCDIGVAYSAELIDGGHGGCAPEEDCEEVAQPGTSSTTRDTHEPD